MSSSVDEIGGSACGATEAQISAGDGENVELYADVSEPLRGDLTYIEAALSYYHGSPASDDVRSAWDRITTSLRNVEADYLRLLREKVDHLFGADANSSEGQRLSPSEASAGNAGLDDLNPLPPDIKEWIEELRRSAERPNSGDVGGTAWILSDEGRKTRDRDRLRLAALLSLAGERDEALTWNGHACNRIAQLEAARLLAEKQLAEAVGVLERVDGLLCAPGCAPGPIGLLVRAFLAQHQSPQSSKGAADAGA